MQTQKFFHEYSHGDLTAKVLSLKTFVLYGNRLNSVCIYFTLTIKQMLIESKTSMHCKCYVQAFLKVIVVIILGWQCQFQPTGGCCGIWIMIVEIHKHS